jgi:PAS domain-containing protein
VLPRHPPPMAPQPVGLILVRHLASRLAEPIFVIASAGEMIYFNGPAEAVLGRRYEEISGSCRSPSGPRQSPRRRLGALSPQRGSRWWVALRQSIPAHGRLEIVSGDGRGRFSTTIPAHDHVTVDRLTTEARAAFDRLQVSRPGRGRSTRTRSGCRTRAGTWCAIRPSTTPATTRLRTSSSRVVDTGDGPLPLARHKVR